MKKYAVLLTLIILGSAFTGCSSNSMTVTTGSLFEEMIDMTNLSYFPDPFYRNVQYSSFDHRSQIPSGPDWFANADGFGGDPIPNFEEVLRAPDEDGVGEYLIADVEGPGAIVRLWTAWITGTIKMYIDGSEEPVYDGAAQDFFRNTFDHYKEIKQVDTVRFEKTIYQQDASYTPIPFAKHLRLIWVGKIEDIHFYHVQVRLYDKSAKVKSFSPTDITRYQETIDRVSKVLANPDEHIKGDSEKSFRATLAPAEKKKVFKIEGPKAVQVFSLRLQADDIDKALRQTVLQVICDEYPWGQVQSPVGDFFGAAPGINPYQSLPFTVQPDGTMICRFVMPFSKSLEIQLENFGEQEVSVTGTAQLIDYAWNKRSMHFRAKWRVSHDLIGSGQDIIDLPFLIAHGEGLYVGTTSLLMNPCGPPTPYGAWWGEGDEKVFTDDDTFPSIFGTGSEDYYNYSWSIPDIFYHPYCGQPRDDGPGNRGFVTNYRWQILDPIPFRKNIRFFMELCTHERTPGLSYARIGYHYGKPGVMDDCEPQMPEDVRHLQLPENWQPVAKKGSANSVFYAAEELLTEAKETRLAAGRLWQGSKILNWYPKGQGDRISFAIPIQETGKRRIYITAALTPRSGTVGVILDGQPVVLRDETDSIDLYRPYRTLLRNFALKTLELTAGKHTLELVYKGSEGNIPNPEIGIDFIWVQKTNR